MRLIACLLTLFTLLGASAPQPRILLFSHSTGFRHASIEAGVAGITMAARREGLTVVASESPTVFDGDGLKGFAAIVLLNTTSDGKQPESEWFAGPRRETLQRFVRAGGGVVAIHAAADSHTHWPWYTRMIGGRFAHHPKGTPRGTLHRVTPDHPATRMLAPHFERVDEWYYFEDHDPETRVLVTLDPGSIGEADVNPNPISWSHEFEGGRIFYTAMGHTPESYAEPLFMQHLMGGLKWTMRRGD